jgi:ferrous iron transport protein B
VGNFPGITVDVLEAEVELPGGERARIVDLPGTYSLRAGVDPESDEGVARRYIDSAREGPGRVLVAQVLDSTNLALNLRLTEELRAMGLPLLVLATQRDVLESEGRRLNVSAFEAALGVPVLWVSARERTTRATVLEALRASTQDRVPTPLPRPLDVAQVARAALGTPALVRSGGSGGVDGRLKLFRRTARLDRVLMHPFLGPLAFLGLMAGLFTLVLLAAAPASLLIGKAVDLLAGQIHRALGPGILSGLLCEGVLSGAGTVLQFLPQIVLLTVALELVEASGYLARGAYLVDRLLRLFGLGGRSFVPLLMGHACAVPAITATRSIRDPRQRLRTLLVIPLTTCSARIPAYVLLIATFFPTLGALAKALVFLSLYVLGLLSTAVASLIIGAARERNAPRPLFVLELPPYRAPQPAQVARTAWRGGMHFVKEVGTVIVAVSAVLYILLSVPVVKAPPVPPPPGAPARTVLMSRSAAAWVGRALEPLSRPLGFDWRVNVGLIGAFGAREVMVSTMGVIFGIENAKDAPVSDLSSQIRGAKGPDGRPAYPLASGLALLAFFVLACQCMSTVAALRRETKGWRWPLFVVGYSYAGAYLAALVVFKGASALGLG